MKEMLIQVIYYLMSSWFINLKKNPCVCLKWISMIELYNYLVWIVIARLTKLEQFFGNFYRLGLINKLYIMILYICKLHYYNNLNVLLQF